MWYSVMLINDPYKYQKEDSKILGLGWFCNKSYTRTLWLGFFTDVCSLSGTVGGLPACLRIRVHGETGTY